jgi:hypothetical protein
MAKGQKETQCAGGSLKQTIEEILATPLNTLHTRRILEFLAPLRLFVEVDEYSHAHLLGTAGLEGHFQVGVLAAMQEWTPAQDQSLLCWKQTQADGCILHLIQRSQQVNRTDLEIALVQHCPPTSVDSDRNGVIVTPLWDKQKPFEQPDLRLYQRGRSYLCDLMRQCPCQVYRSMRERYQAQDSEGGSR